MAYIRWTDTEKQVLADQVLILQQTKPNIPLIILFEDAQLVLPPERRRSSVTSMQHIPWLHEAMLASSLKPETKEMPPVFGFGEIKESEISPISELISTFITNFANENTGAITAKFVLDFTNDIKRTASSITTSLERISECLNKLEAAQNRLVETKITSESHKTTWTSIDKRKIAIMGILPSSIITLNKQLDFIIELLHSEHTVPRGGEALFILTNFVNRKDLDVAYNTYDQSKIIQVTGNITALGQAIQKYLDFKEPDPSRNKS